VANTMIMSVFTRIREIAILRVNGFSSAQIAGIVFGESALVSAAGALTGLVLGVLVIATLQSVPMLHGYIDARVQPVVVLAVVALAGLTGVAGAFYPAIYAMRVRAVEALRFE
jgi:putative ABC transport system permease protein